MFVYWIYNQQQTPTLIKNENAWVYQFSKRSFCFRKKWYLNMYLVHHSVDNSKDCGGCHWEK